VDGKNKKVVHCMDWLPAPHLEQKRNIRMSVVGGFRGGGGVAIAFIGTKRCHIQSHLTACWTTSDQLSECSAIGTFS
jgi:hypothetical protein